MRAKSSRSIVTKRSPKTPKAPKHAPGQYPMYNTVQMASGGRQASEVLSGLCPREKLGERFPPQSERALKETDILIGATEGS